MNTERLLLDALRVATILGLALASLPLFRRASAAARRLVLTLALGGALVLPAVSALAPAWPVIARPAAPVLHGLPPIEPVSDGAAAPAMASPAVARPPAPTSAPVLLRAAPSLLAGLWAVVALALLIRLAASIVHARSLVRRASPAAAWARAAAEAERATGLRAEVRVTDAIDSPAVTGILAPVVLVPRASEAWSDTTRLAVLLHELAHVRRRDCLVQIVAQLACALHWFDPLAWVAARRLRLEGEIAADDAVLASGARATRYAEDLLAIAGAHPAPPFALGMAEPSQLAVRVAAIVAKGSPRAPLSRPRAALLAVCSGAVLLAVACAQPEAPDSATPSPTPPRAVPGATSTLDPRLQQIADEELDRTVAEWQPSAGVILVLDPATGEILANAGRAGGARADVALGRTFITGSTLKAVTLAAALEEGVVAEADRFDCEEGKRAYGARTLEDSRPNGTLTLPEMLAVSSNVGFSRIFDRLGGDRLGRWLRRFHFGGVPAAIEDRSYEGAMTAIGDTLTASPLQMAAAYAVIANGGAYVEPTLSRRAAPAAREAILRPETARALIGMLEAAVNGERSTGKDARIAGARVAGKTGTASWELPGGGQGRYASFIGIVPADRPRFVILVGVEGPREEGTGGTAAAPAFARVAARAIQGG